MVKFLDEQEWRAAISEKRVLMFNEQSEVVNAIANSFSLKPVYIVCYRKERLVLSLIVYTKNKKIVSPIHFFYTVFWIDKGINNDAKYVVVVNELIKSLISKYDKITLRLPIEMKDVRPFIWNNFSISNNYTYIKQLDNLNYHPVTRRNIEKCTTLDYRFTEEQLSNENLNKNLAFFFKLGTYPTKKINTIRTLINELAKTSYLKNYCLYFNDVIIASYIVFSDELNKVAYMVMVSQSSKNFKDNAHSFFYHSIFVELQKKGYQCIDLMGANILSIADFKSRFNPTLTQRFVVHYDRKSVALKASFKSVKDLAKRVVSRFI